MKIGDLARVTETKVETVRYYEKLGLMAPPERTASNYRIYGEADLARLSFIRRARSLGFTLDAIRDLLRLADDEHQPCEAVDIIARAHLAAIDQKLSDLAALKSELTRLISSCQHGTVADCQIIGTLAPARRFS